MRQVIEDYKRELRHMRQYASDIPIEMAIVAAAAALGILISS